MAIMFHWRTTSWTWEMFRSCSDGGTFLLSGACRQTVPYSAALASQSDRGYKVTHLGWPSYNSGLVHSWIRSFDAMEVRRQEDAVDADGSGDIMLEILL
jgi:hypothetical protein